MVNVLALDISTSIIGVCVLDFKKELLLLDHINLKKEKDLYDKTDTAVTKLKDIISKFSIENVIIEEPLKHFMAGKSSASTIITLSAFNALVSYFMFTNTKNKPIHMSAATARKACNIKVLKNGIPAKKQVFEYVRDVLLQDFNWPVKKSGSVKDFCYDMSDAYVIGLGFLNS